MTERLSPEIHELTEKEIREDERLRIAGLIDAGKDVLVDFTGGSTIAALELVVFLLKLDPNAGELDD